MSSQESDLEVYPVISLLRRACAKVIYFSSRSPCIDHEGPGGPHLHLPTPGARYFAMGVDMWSEGKATSIPVMELIAFGTDPMTAAQNMTRHENAIAEEMGVLPADDASRRARTYTLLLGPARVEPHPQGKEGVLHHQPIVILEGIFLAKKDKIERNQEAQPARDTMPRVVWRDLPPGVVEEKR